MRKFWRRIPARKRIATMVAGVAMAALVSACAPTGFGQTYNGCTGPSAPPTATISRVFQLTNSDRAANGVPPLSWNPQLWCLANEWSNYMAATGLFQHRNLNQVLADPQFAGYNTLGENILMGSASLTGDQMEYSWMASPEHRANILSPYFTSIGIGIAYANGTVYATENFGG